MTVPLRVCGLLTASSGSFEIDASVTALNLFGAMANITGVPLDPLNDGLHPSFSVLLAMPAFLRRVKVKYGSNNENIVVRRPDGANGGTVRLVQVQPLNTSEWVTVFERVRNLFYF